MTAILVVGSIHADARAGVDRLPRPGETVIACSHMIGLGGKGANQAVAAARGGADVRMIGAVGADPNGVQMLSVLRDEGVDVSLVRAGTKAPTGFALVAVDAGGENLIVVAPGADATVTPEALADLAAAPDGWPQAGVTLCQGELPPETVDRAAALAAQSGSAFALNLAPVIPVASATLGLADPLVLNELEASQVAAARLPGFAAQTVSDVRTARRFAAQALAAGLSRSLVVTLGPLGAVAGAGANSAWGEAEVFCAAPGAPVTAVDTTGAGDAFVGQVVAELAAGTSFRQAVIAGVAAGSLAVTRPGACGSYATAREIEDFARRVQVTGRVRPGGHAQEDELPRPGGRAPVGERASAAGRTHAAGRVRPGGHAQADERVRPGGHAPVGDQTLAGKRACAGDSE
jgi:ribokinase